jgi:hypothetical protein
MLKSCHSTKNVLVSHSTGMHSESKGKMFSKKKSQVQLVTLCRTASKGQITLGSHDSLHHSSQHSKVLRKESSSKHLKLGSTSSG